MMRTLAIAVLALASFSAVAAEVAGLAKVIDGDTVQIGSHRVRLQGMDAPETDQICLDHKGERWACGLAAREQLTKHANNGPWICRGTTKDRFGRLIATCEVNGENVQRWMVHNGWALSFVRYSHIYDAEEAEARPAKSGLWAGAFIAPWDWRNRNRNTVILGAMTVPAEAREKLLSAASAAGAPAPGCDIKGNVNRSGVCIYHQPGSRWYAKINMELNGKRWFCSTQEAEAAGCRATKR
ncbi:MAG: thermonuclease family protein [Afipia sp.]|nr:thermonuclease family protein [Afipia sp.]